MTALFITVRDLARQNHRGTPKELNFHKANIAPYLNKIRYIVVDLPDYGNTDLAGSMRETYQCNAIMQGLHDASSEDMVMYSCCDEIPDPRLLADFERCTQEGITKVGQYLSYYYFNNRTSEPWYGTTIARRKHFDAIVDLRNRTAETTNSMTNAGWHASYCGGIDTIHEKLIDFCHADMIAPFATKEHITGAVANGTDLFHRPDMEFTYVPRDDTFPPNIERFPDLCL